MPYELAPPRACPVNFADFAIPLLLGTIAGAGAHLIAKHAFMRDEAASTREAVGRVARGIAFFGVAGTAWILRTRHARI